MYTLGLDIGNGTIKVVVIDSNKNIVHTNYVRNNGIIETLSNCLSNGFNYPIYAVGVTGAGRRLASYLVNADVVKTEIICHAVGAQHFVPNVRTIFEIGANDNKIIFLNNGIVTDFSTQSICASGTGNFLETISNRLGITVDRFAEYALKSTNPCNISSKCTVFALSNCVAYLNSGYSKEDILMGVANALIRNYISTLAKGKKLYPPYVFQGGVSQNKAVVEALKQYLGDDVIVPNHSQLMGAIGASILALKCCNNKAKVFNINHNSYTTKPFVCKHCSNNCEIISVRNNDNIVGYVGSICGRWD